MAIHFFTFLAVMMFRGIDSSPLACISASALAKTLAQLILMRKITSKHSLKQLPHFFGLSILNPMGILHQHSSTRGNHSGL